MVACFPLNPTKKIMAKLSITANPKFTSNVSIPVAGGESSNVLLTFKHRTKSQLDEFIKTRADASDVDSFMAMVDGWDLDAAFERDNAETFLENYIGAALAIYRAYIDELVKSKAKN